MAAVSLVDIGTLDLAAGEPLSGFDDGAQRVTVTLPAAAPARLEAVFLSRSGGGVHRQGQGQRAL